MNDIQVTSMTTKGHVVIPSEIRGKLNITSGSKFVVLTDGKNILLKPIEKPKMEIFKDLINKSKKVAKESGYTKNDIQKLKKQVRREYRS